MDMAFILLSCATAGFSVYHLLPVLVCAIDSRMIAANWHRNINKTDVTIPFLLIEWLPANWLKKLKERLYKAGYFSDNALTIYLSLQIIPIPVLLLAGQLFGLQKSRIIWIGIILITLINSHISRRIIIRQKAFSKALYRIYRFLDLQMTAGINVVDSIRGLPEAVHDPHIQPTLIRFSALFELTLNLDLAFEEIRKAFSGSDCELLATHLRQCLQTGQAGRSLARMEELLFSRYFSLMQIDTKRIRTQLLIAAVLGIFPCLILFLYPLLFEAIQAMNTVFG